MELFSLRLKTFGYDAIEAYEHCADADGVRRSFVYLVITYIIHY